MEDKLFLEVKSHLQVTWSDEETDSKIIRIIEDAKPILNHKLGAIIDYSKSGMEHNLFLNYCFYQWNNCANEFDNNYINDIYQIRILNEVKSYEENQV